MATEVVMPQITMTMIEGVIAVWHKKEGERVTEGEPLADIETDKVVQTLNASASGVFLKACAQPGDVVPVGKPICVIGEPGYTSVGQRAEEQPAVRVSAGKKPAAASFGERANERIVELPRLTPRMKDAVLVRWLCREGDFIEAGSPLCDAEVDDARRVIEAPEGGRVARLIARSGETLVPGDALYALNSDVPVVNSLSSGVVCASPLAKRLAASVGLDLSTVAGAGPGGMIVESDVRKNLLTPQTDPAVSSVRPVVRDPRVDEDTEVIPFTGIRRRIADNLMVTKKNMADVTTFAEVNMSNVTAFRQYLHLSYNAFILRAVALALGDYPVMNSSVEGDSILVRKTIGLCVAVSTGRGLVTPVMRRAENLNLIGIAETLEDFAERGRAGKLTAADFEGGTFTMTNSGAYGALFFTPIINSPQSAILGVGKIMMTPVVDETRAVVAAPMMYLCLTYDHRVVDGETAVKFLQRVKYYLEHPDQMTVIRKKQ